MATIQEINPEFASAGTIEAPSSGKRSLGWVKGEKPPYEWFNWAMNQSDRRTNQLAKAVASASGGQMGGDPYDAVRRNSLNDSARSWDPSNSFNSMAIGDSATAATVGYDAVAETPILFWIEADDWAVSYPTKPKIHAIQCWNHGTSELSIQEQELELDIGSLSTSGSAGGLSLCAVDDYLYVLFRLSDGLADDTTKLARFAISNWTGVADAIETVAYESTGSWYSCSHLIQSDANHVLFVANYYSAGPTIVECNLSDCTVSRTQAALIPAPGTRVIASDGTKLFAVVHGATSVVLWRITISTWYGEYYTIESGTANRRVSDLFPLGGGDVVVAESSAYGVATDESFAYTIGSADDVSFEPNTGRVFLYPNVSLTSRPLSIGFDGSSLYFPTRNIDKEALSMFKFDICRFLAAPDGSATDDSDYPVETAIDFTVAPDRDILLTNDDSQQMFTLFDGRDLWIIVAIPGDANNAIYRVVAAPARR